MNNSFIVLFIIFNSLFIYATPLHKPITVAVIDTGFGFNGKGKGAKLCKTGHIDFTIEQAFNKDLNTETPVPIDFNGHGTNVAGIIEKFANIGNIDYCLIIIKYYIPDSSKNVEATIQAFNYATNIKADYINYSSGGVTPTYEEKKVVLSFLNSGGTMVVAAGNKGVELGIPGNSYFPAMYDPRIIVVGSLKKNGERLSSSNFGVFVNTWEIGESVTAYGITLSGTSQATATITGKLIAKRKR